MESNTAPFQVGNHNPYEAASTWRLSRTLAFNIQTAMETDGFHHVAFGVRIRKSMIWLQNALLGWFYIHVERVHEAINNVRA